jgi:3-oxoadipate enol-lactonase
MPTARVGDIELFYELVDCTEPWKAGRPPVVFLHGLGGTHRMWIHQIPAFCGDFPTIVLDLRGHGSSSKPNNDWSTFEMAQDVARLLRDLGVEKAHIVGCSLGGMVAQQFGLEYPYATTSLVLVDTLCGIPAELQDVARSSLEFIEKNPMSVVAKQRITNAFSDRVDPMMRDHYIGEIAQNEKAPYLRAARAAFGFSMCHRLEEIKAPTLVVVGEADRVTPPPLSEELASCIRGARLVRIPEAGHISNVERPVEFNETVREFLLPL